jgi:hypothetical protein
MRFAISMQNVTITFLTASSRSIMMMRMRVGRA